jgi:hypothetical protein
VYSGCCAKPHWIEARDFFDLLGVLRNLLLLPLGKKSLLTKKVGGFSSVKNRG